MMGDISWEAIVKAQTDMAELVAKLETEDALRDVRDLSEQARWLMDERAGWVRDHLDKVGTLIASSRFPEHWHGRKIVHDEKCYRVRVDFNLSWNTPSGDELWGYWLEHIPMPLLPPTVRPEPRVNLMAARFCWPPYY